MKSVLLFAILICPSIGLVGAASPGLAQSAAPETATEPAAGIVAGARGELIRWACAVSLRVDFGDAALHKIGVIGNIDRPGHALQTAPLWDWSQTLQKGFLGLEFELESCEVQ